MFYLTLFTFFQVAEIYWILIRHALPRTILEILWRLERLPSVGSWMLQSRVMQPLKAVACLSLKSTRGRWIMWKDIELRMNKGKYIQHKLSEQIFENIWKHIDIETNACNHMYNKHLNIKLDQYDLWHYENVDLHKMLSLIARPIGFQWSFSSPEARECSIFPQVVCRGAKIKWFWIVRSRGILQSAPCLFRLLPLFLCLLFGC